MYSYGIIIASDKGYSGERQDKCIDAIKEVVGSMLELKESIVLPDEEELLSNKMIEYSDDKSLNLILTSGGTGFSKRDVTVEATNKVIMKETPGISEAMRYHSLQITSKAMLSRATSGIRNNTLIINLPGSPKAVKEILEYILKPLIHGLEVLNSDVSECGR